MREGVSREATIGWRSTKDRHWIVWAVCPGFGTAEARAFDAFEALCLVREQLEPYGWSLGVVGAQRDVWPSGMSRDQGGGAVAYRLGDRGAEEHVQVFEPADPSTTTTVAEQQATAEDHYRRWMPDVPEISVR